MKNIYSIGDMAKFGHCKVQTIRYYEEIELLPVTERTDGNRRIFTETHRHRLLFIRHSRELGFSLGQIRQILALYNEPDHTCHEVDAIAKLHLVEVQSRIARLQSMEIELQRMINCCSNDRIASCNIVAVLSDHNLCSQEHDHNSDIRHNN